MRCSCVSGFLYPSVERFFCSPVIASSYPDPENPHERKDLVVKLCESQATCSTHLEPNLCIVSQDPGNYADAPTEGIRRVLEIVTGDTIPRGSVLETEKIGVWLYPTSAYLTSIHPRVL